MQCFRVKLLFISAFLIWDECRAEEMVETTVVKAGRGETSFSIFRKYDKDYITFDARGTSTNAGDENWILDLTEINLKVEVFKRFNRV